MLNDPELDLSTPGAPKVKLTWTPSTKNTDGSAITGTVTFNLYRGVDTPGKVVKTHPGLTGTTFTVVANLHPGTTQYFGLTEVVNGRESVLSNIVSTKIPA